MHAHDDSVAAAERAVLSALPRAEPFAAAKWIAALLERVDEARGVRLVQLVVARYTPDNWLLLAPDDGTEGWPGRSLPTPVCEELARAVRALPARSEDRVRGLCYLARWITEDERREALDALLDGIVPTVSSGRSGVPYGQLHVHRALLRHATPAERDAWVAFYGRQIASSTPTLEDEALARDEIDHWPPHALERHTAASLADARSRGEADFHLLRLLRRMDAARRREALEIVRAQRGYRRLLALRYFGDELTDEERLEVVQTPWSWVSRARFDDESQTVAQHLGAMAERGHLARVPYEARRAWLEQVRALPSAFWRGHALEHLLPVLSGDDHAQTARELAASLADDEFGASVDVVIRHAPPDALEDAARALAAHGDSPYRADRFLECVLDTPATLRDRLVAPFLARLSALDATDHVTRYALLLPWFAARDPRLSARLADAVLAAPERLPAEPPSLPD